MLPKEDAELSLMIRRLVGPKRGFASLDKLFGCSTFGYSFGVSITSMGGFGLRFS